MNLFISILNRFCVSTSLRFLVSFLAASMSRQVSNNQILLDDIHLTDIDPAFEGRVLRFNVP